MWLRAASQPRPSRPSSSHQARQYVRGLLARARISVEVSWEMQLSSCRRSRARTRRGSSASSSRATRSHPTLKARSPSSVKPPCSFTATAKKRKRCGLSVNTNLKLRRSLLITKSSEAETTPGTRVLTTTLGTLPLTMATTETLSLTISVCREPTLEERTKGMVKAPGLMTRTRAHKLKPQPVVPRDTFTAMLDSQNPKISRRSVLNKPKPNDNWMH